MCLEHAQLSTCCLRLNAAQRLVNNAEEVAFNDPPGGTAEKLVLNRHLAAMLRHARLSALQRFFQQVLACGKQLPTIPGLC